MMRIFKHEVKKITANVERKTGHLGERYFEINLTIESENDVFKLSLFSDKAPELKGLEINAPIRFVADES